jgi:type II secretory pathway component PulJ
MKFIRQDGLTLLEVVIYIGLISILLTGLTVAVLQTLKAEVSSGIELRMGQTSSALFLYLGHEMTEATSINVTSSTLDISPSVFVFVDRAGNTVTIDRVESVIDFSGTSQTVNRLRLVRGVEAAVWLTDRSINVTTWQVDPVRDTGTLVGLRFTLDMDIVGAGTDVYRQGAYGASTTMSLLGQTTEL